MTDSLFLSLAEKSSDALAVVSDNGDIQFANKTFQSLICDESGNRKRIRNLSGSGVPDDIREELKRLIRATLSAQRERVCSFELGRKKGDARQLNCRLIPCMDSGDKRVLLEIRDETLTRSLQLELQEKLLFRRQGELLLERRKRLFFGLLDDLPTFVYLQRRDYTVAFANKRVRKLYGESENRLCYEVFAGRSSPCPVCPTFEVFDTGKSVEWEFTDNNGRTFLIYDYPYEDETGEPLVLEMGVDITELKNVEKELFQAQKLRAIGVLAGGIAHDLNNNLVPIIFNIEYAKGKIDDLDILEPLDDALQAANRAADLVAQVLEYSRQQDVSRSPLHLTPLVESCIKEIEATLPEQICIVSDLQAASDMIKANATQMQQVALNLLRNALQSMPEGGTITVSISTREITEDRDNRLKELPPGEYVVLETSDTGIGIRPDTIEQIFEPFFTSRKGRGGTGMGLAVVHSIVTGSGGRILVDSTLGIGTVFSVWLPKSCDPQATLEGELCQVESGNIHILLVDDDPGPLEAMARALREEGFTVETAGSGEKGVQMFRVEPDRYGLVLADQSMPGMTGLQMSAQMLSLCEHARIVICTGHIEPSLEEQAKQQGIAGFARKPMSPAMLAEVARRYCRDS